MAKSSKPRKKKPAKLSAEEKVLREVNSDLREAHNRSLEFIVEAKDRLDNLRYHVENDLTTVTGEYKEKALEVIDQAEEDYKALKARHENTSKKIKEELEHVNVKDEIEVAQFVLQAPIRYAEFAEEIINYATNVDTEVRRVELESQGKTPEEIEQILMEETTEAAEVAEGKMTEEKSTNEEEVISDAEIIEETTEGETTNE